MQGSGDNKSNPGCNLWLLVNSDDLVPSLYLGTDANALPLQCGQVASGPGAQETKPPRPTL